MNSSKHNFITGILVFAALQLAAQDFPREEIDMDAFVQELFAVQEEDVDYSDLYESLFQFYRQPLNLNKAEREDLQSLFVLSEAQINNLLDHREKNGKFLSIYELQAVPGFDLQAIYRLVPFVSVRDAGLTGDNRNLWQRIMQEENRFLIVRYRQVLQQQKGYTKAEPNANGALPSRYLGDQGQLYVRFRASHSKDFSIGFTLEKDAGEAYAWDPSTQRFVTDFASFHLALFDRGKFKAIALGDYSMQIGQGLLLTGGFQVGKGSETTATIRRSTRGIIPYSSALESNFFRGAAATYDAGNFEVTAFGSVFDRDGSITANLDSASEAEDFINSIQQSGLHRTQTELNGKATTQELVYGGHVRFVSPAQNLTLGMTALNTHYQFPVSRRPSDYNQYEFSGDENFAFGADFTYLWQNFSFFGEAARSQSGGTGLITGFVASLSQRIEMAFSFRNYDRDFHSFYGRAFGEGTRNINEQGFYWGLKYKPNRRWILAAYHDQFKFPWLRFRVDAPSVGNESLIRITHRPTKKVTLWAQYRFEAKPRNLSDNVSNFDQPVKTDRTNWWLNADWAASKVFSLRSRILMSTFEAGGEKSYGYAAFQDLDVNLGKFRISGRMALFDTDNYDTRLYAYEKDVLYTFAIPALSDQETRQYLLLYYKPTKKFRFWLKYAVTTFRNRDTIGSGLEEINGNKRSDIRAQVMYKF
jgi:hypothetical protein